MDASRLGRGETIAAISAVALFLVMSLVDWFGHADRSANAWQSFGFIDLVLFLAIVAAVGTAALAMSDSRPELPASPAIVTFGLGAFSALLILYRIINPPDLGYGDAAAAFGVDFSIGPRLGAFLGLIAAAGVAYGGWLATQEDGRSAPPGRRRGGSRA